MFEGRKVSVVIPAHNEEATIAEVVEGFRRRAPAVDEILVVDNNCSDRTAELARAAGARVVQEALPGYGCALRRGMDEAAGEVLVLVEADGSFRPEDALKLLVYLQDADMIVGTRTTRQLVEQGANMRQLLRWGNVAVAKGFELLWYLSCEPRLTDVGCTYRALSREAWQQIRPHVREPGPAFSPEMMAEAMIQRLRMIEVPVHYLRRRGGESKHSAGWYKVARTATNMIRAILRKRREGFARGPDRTRRQAGGTR
jgi:glycosyltransferase involved in cell wall biosynthesis